MPHILYCGSFAVGGAGGDSRDRREFEKRLGFNVSMDKEIITIDRLRPGESAVVEYIAPSPLCGRLRDLGLVSGTAVRCLHRGPFGDPQAYGIRGAVIALRREDSRFVYAVRGDDTYG